jgi:predicted branched-subunit amino acid permease
MAMSFESKNALRAGIAVGTATAAYGFSFGALSVASGLNVWQTCVLSLFMFSGGSQFAVVGILASGGVSAGPAAIATSTFLGLRNGIYSLRIAPIVQGSWFTRVVAAQLVGFWATGVAVYVGWNLTTLMGALVGNLLGDVSKLGLDAVAAAAFVGLLWPRLRQLQASVVAGVAAVVATALIPFAPPGVPVLAAAVVAVVVGLTNWFHRADPIGQPDDSSDPGNVMGMHVEGDKP